MSVTLVSRVSNQSRETAKQAIKSGIIAFRPKQIVLSFSPSIVKDKDPYHMDAVLSMVKREAPECNVSWLPGTDDRRQMAQYWFRMFDQAECDWIVNIDDDDMIFFNPWVDDIVILDDRRGMFHTDVLAVWMEKPDFLPHDAGHIQLRRSREITDRIDSKLAYGSFWGMRRSAWEDIRDEIERDQVGYNDFRIWWHLLRKGWRDHHIPFFLQLQRVKNPRKVPMYMEVRERGGWTAVHKEMMEKWG
jgi:hypothetical protein